MSPIKYDMKAVSLLAAGAFILFSAFIKTTERKTQRSLYETKWALKKIHDSTGVTEVNGKAFIKFHEAKKSAGGNGGCNTFGSDFTLEGKKIRFSNLFSTRMYCEGIQPTEDAFFRQLGRVNRFKIKGDLLLLYRDSQLLLEFKSTSQATAAGMQR